MGYMSNVYKPLIFICTPYPETRIVLWHVLTDKTVTLLEPKYEMY